MLSRPRSRDYQWWIETGLFCSYALLVGVASWKHIFWRDEAQAWLIARDSGSVLNLVHNVRHEAHPPLWHLVLFGISRFTKNPEWMKVPTLLCALVTAYLLLHARRISLWVRAGCTFSYFILFEYAVLDRNYMAGIMLLVAAALWLHDRRHTFLVPVLLALASLTSLSALLVSVCLYILHLIVAAPESNGGNRSTRFLPRGRQLPAGVIFAASTIVSLALIAPPSEGHRVALRSVVHGLAAGGPKHVLALRVLGSMLACGYLPMPQVTAKFWDTHWGLAHPLWVAAIGWTVFAVCVFVPRTRSVCWFFAVASLLLLVELRFGGAAAERRVGWLFVCFILALLVDASQARSKPAAPAAVASKWRSSFVWALLAIQISVGFLFWGTSLRRPFSSSKEVAQFLRDHQLDDAPIIVEPDFAAAAVLAYLPTRRAYFVEIQREGTFVVWNAERRSHAQVITPEAMAAASRSGVRPTLILEAPLTDEATSGLGVKPLATFNEGLCSFDRYYLYR